MVIIAPNRLYLFLSAFVLLLGCQPGDDTLIRIDGSSTVYPITEAVAEEFLKTHPDVSIAIGVSGSGAGLAKLLVGETDIADASRPITATELKTGQQAGLALMELPIAYDGLSVVVHPSNHWVDKLTVAELRTIWQPSAQGKVMRWNQIRPSFPNREIHLYGAGITSGTYEYFTESIVGKARSSRGDYTSSEDYNVLVQGVSTDPLALGYVGLAYYLENKAKLRAIPIDYNGTGGVMPTFKNVRSGRYQPLTRPLFVYLSTQQARRPVVQQFIRYWLAKAPTLVKETGYVPFSTRVYRQLQQRFAAGKTGSLVAGKKNAGVRIDQLLHQ